ncbi:MAG: MoaD/ThiS family protein [Dehalococcoidales bacterium]|nr:MoaD/ThiS family protein [Dehalococcoidales bacterium]
MSINVNLAAYLRQYAADKENVSVNGQTVRECLDALIKQYPKLKDQIFDKDNVLLPYVSVFAGGEIAYAGKLDKPVQDGATINILYIIGGG